MFHMNDSNKDNSIKNNQDEKNNNTPSSYQNLEQDVVLVPSQKQDQKQQQKQQQQQPNDDDDPPNLFVVVWNILCCFMAWALTVSISTLVIGTCSPLILAMGANDVALTSLPIGAFFVGLGLVSGCSVSTTLFTSYGDRYGLIIGNILFGLLTGISTSLFSIFYAITSLYIISNIFIGMSIGMNFYIRYMVTELVPVSYKTYAVTLTVSGGVIAAFLGPETSYYITQKPLFITEEQLMEQPYLKYLSAYFMVGIFYIINIICIIAIRDPSSKTRNNVESRDSDVRSNRMALSFRNIGSIALHRLQLWMSLLQHREFLLPMLINALSWTIMVVPMSIVRVAMKDWTIYTSLQSLRVIEFHFTGMYATGFITGHIISYIGYIKTCLFGIIISFISISISLIIKYPTEEQQQQEQVGSASMVLWALSMTLCGIGWNFAFTSATVWITQLYVKPNNWKNSIQTLITPQQEQPPQHQRSDSNGEDITLSSKVATEQPVIHQNDQASRPYTIAKSQNLKSPNVTIDTDDDEMMEIYFVSTNHNSSDNNSDQISPPLVSSLSANGNLLDEDIESSYQCNDRQGNSIPIDENDDWVDTNDSSKKNLDTYTKEQIQSTNEFFMFMIAGIFTFFASYIYHAGNGGGLYGWRIINCVVLGINLIYFIIICHYAYSTHQ